MTRVAGRLILTVLLLICAPGFYLGTGIATAMAAEATIPSWDLEQTLGPLVVAWMIMVDCAVLLFLLWLIWRKVVAWTPRRRRTVRRVAIWAPAAALAQTVFWVLMPFPEMAFAAFFASGCNLFITALCAAALVWSWIETPKERLARLSAAPDKVMCAACRYDMSGLSVTTCPECGTAYSVMKLFEEQQRRVNPPALD